MKKDKKKTDSDARKFGTFGGVFTPSVLTILGVILFLRYDTVIGNAGLWGALLVLFIAKLFTTITTFSLSSIATNMKVKGGGSYYLISRSLGVEFGGVIAVFFYIALALAVSLYVVGFTEAVFLAFPEIGISFTMVATLANIVVFIFVYIGAGWTIKVQYFILAIVLAAIGSYCYGAFGHASLEIMGENLKPAWTANHSLLTIFALFFPAVTGIEAGINMSGDLKNPSKSIPRGTFIAIGFTILIYAGIGVLMASSTNRELLVGKEMVMAEKAWFSPLVFAGVIAATLSSALGSMMGAPRILQAFAKDNIFKWLKYFALGSGKSNEPRRAILITFVFTQIGILAGDLDNIAPIITMFFLITYGTINLASFFESISKNPTFRPTFKLSHWSISLLGALMSLAIMYLVNWLWASIAIVASIAMFIIIKRAQLIVQWGDVLSGYAYQRARNALLALEKEKYHSKNWRPSILSLSGIAGNRMHLVKYANLLSAERGLVSLAQIISGDLETLNIRRMEGEKLLRDFIRKEELSAFPVVVVEEKISDGLKALLQCHGIGGLRPNIVLLGWSNDPEKKDSFTSILNLTKKMERSCLILRSHEEEKSWEDPFGAINIWWTDSKNGAMMLLLAYLLKGNREWRDCPLRVLRPVAPKADLENVEKEMSEILQGGRIKAEIVVLPTDSPLEAVSKAMTPSALLFAGFEPSDEDPVSFLLPFMEQIVDLPGDVILTYNAGDLTLES
ncbi:MAG: amino acid permease [Prolixibacteraceae bacterium]|nr:amino acid permease [Prolixibacteraceae bacterium]